MTDLTQEERWTVAARPDQAGPLRRQVTAYAGALGMPAQRLQELTLAVGEAIANAVIHAYRDAGPGTVDVTAGVRDGAVVVAVRDHGCGLVPRPDSPGLGLGLGVISQIADSLRIRPGDHGGTEVHMTFALPGRAAVH
jgi:serine/threonine-protein kinase RsbW/stage II sporulation protein AB (anti-sigma F factor)